MNGEEGVRKGWDFFFFGYFPQAGDGCRASTVVRRFKGGKWIAAEGVFSFYSVPPSIDMGVCVLTTVDVNTG